MKINISSVVSESAKVVVFPFLDNDAFESNLSKVATKLRANADTLKQEFKAEKNQVVTCFTADSRNYLLGLGKKNGSSEYLSVFRIFLYKNKARFQDEISIDLSNLEVNASQIEQIVTGLYLAENEVAKFKTDKSKSANFFDNADAAINLVVSIEMVEAAIKAANNGKLIAMSMIEMINLGNAPANYKFPQTLADWATNSGIENGYSVKVFDENQCEEIGLKALLAVGKGSEHPPRFIVLEYKPAEYAKTIGLVGKGVTFDTGGISIKDSTNMHLMKSDMGGAAAVLGTVELAAKLKLPIHVIGVIPTTENSVDGFATKPGDVIGSYLGKTIEVIDTDAEGRLILADGLAYINQQFSPDVIIDLATLTGSVIGTLGYHAAGLFSNNAQLVGEITVAANKTGEKVWQLPLWEDYENELKSDVADLKNYHGKPFAGAIVAAKFLEVFTEKHPAWAHLDIAGTAFADSDFASMKSATAYGVRLLTEWLRMLSENAK